MVQAILYVILITLKIKWKCIDLNKLNGLGAFQKMLDNGWQEASRLHYANLQNAFLYLDA